MKILQISTGWDSTPPRVYDPPAQVVSGLTEELVRLGHEVTLFATGDSLTNATLAYKFVEAPKSINLENEIVHVNAAVAFAASHNFDVVHNHDVGYGVIGCTTLHTPCVTRMCWLGDQHLENFIRTNYPRPNDGPKFTAVSNALRKAVPYLNWVDTVYNGLDIETFPYQEEKESFMLFLGRIQPEKGPDTAIKVAHATGVPLVIAGPLWPQWQSYFDAKIRPHIDGRNVQWLGAADQRLKRELFAKAMAFLMPISYEEAFGLVMVEAMACGTPVIAFRRGAAPEIVLDHITGFVVDTVEEMIEAIGRVASIDPRECRTRAEAHFSVQTMAEAYLRVYSRITQS